MNFKVLVVFALALMALANVNAADQDEVDEADQNEQKKPSPEEFRNMCNYLLQK